MNTGFSPICRQDMEDRHIEQFDFVYVIGDAYVTIPPLDMLLSAVC